MFRYKKFYVFEFISPKFYYFFIGKTCNIDDYELTNNFHVFEHLLKNMLYSYTKIET